MLPTKENLTICFAHVAYQMAATFAKRETGINHFQVWSVDEMIQRIGEADVLVISGFWQNELLAKTDKLQFIQSIGAGYDQFPLDQFPQRNIRLANASGVNRNAVSEHAMALLLALTRHIHTGRDHQHNHHWRDMISDLDLREDELGGKTMLVVGMGQIGSRVAKLAAAFDMNVIATKRDPSTVQGSPAQVYTPDRLPELLPQADFVVLTCPLTPDTECIIDSSALAAMKSSAYLINVARGRCVDEPALLQALQEDAIAGAAIDHFWDEPLPADSPFWDLDQVLITPHTGGETRMYEENVIDILIENLERQWRGEQTLYNQVV